MIPLLLLKSLETPLNQLLALDLASAPRLAALEGKPLRIELPFGSWTLAAENGRLIFADAETPAAVTLKGGLADFLTLAQTQGQQAGAVQMQGDVGAAQKWQQFFADLQPDFGAPLAATLGPVAGPLLQQLFARLQAWGQQASASFQAAAAEYVQEEARLIVSKPELEKFARDVDTLRDDAERLLAKARARGIL